MDTVNKKLEWLSKEEIIKRFVSLEFHRFVEYYKNAPDLNEKAEEKRESRSRRDRKNNDNQDESRKRRGQRGNSRFYINIGKKDGINPRDIIGLIIDSTKDRGINIGVIDLKDSFSFFETGKQNAEMILKSFQNKNYKGRNLRVELAEPDNDSPRRKGKRRRI
jgi:ATP-dependent RNA helicase DeaD